MGKCTFSWRLSIQWSNNGHLRVNLRSIFKRAQSIAQIAKSNQWLFFQHRGPWCFFISICVYWMCYISTKFLTLVVPYQRWFGSFLSLVNESSLYLSDFRWFSVTIQTMEGSYSPSVTLAVLYQHWWLYTGFISGSASVIWLWLFLISIAANANSDNSLLALLLWLWWFPYQHCWLYWTRSA